MVDNGQYVCYIPGNSKDILINIEGKLIIFIKEQQEEILYNIMMYHSHIQPIK